MADDAQDVIRRLDDNKNLLDVMVQIEDYLDSLDLYVFENWLDGEIVNGPFVERHWIKFTLKYPYKNMPDPQGGLRLLKYGSKVAFQKATEEVPVEVKSSEDLDPETRKPKMRKEPIWLVHFKIPRRFIEDLDVEGLDLFDEESSEVNDIEDIVSAQAEGIDTETGTAPEAEVGAATAGNEVAELEI